MPVHKRAHIQRRLSRRILSSGPALLPVVALPASLSHTDTRTRKQEFRERDLSMREGRREESEAGKGIRRGSFARRGREREAAAESPSTTTLDLSCAQQERATEEAWGSAEVLSESETEYRTLALLSLQGTRAEGSGHASAIRW